MRQSAGRQTVRDVMECHHSSRGDMIVGVRKGGWGGGGRSWIRTSMQMQTIVERYVEVDGQLVRDRWQRKTKCYVQE